MDHRNAIDISRGGIFEGEAGKALARRCRDDPQRDPDLLGRLELAIAPGEIAVRIKALRVLAQNGDVEIADERLELRPRLHRPDIGEEREVAAQIAARMPLDRIVVRVFAGKSG